MRGLWTATLAVLGAVLSALPQLVSGSLTSPWAIVAATALAALLGAMVDHWRRRGESHQDRAASRGRTAVAGCLSFDGRTLPRVRDIDDPTILGVHKAASPTGHTAAALAHGATAMPTAMPTAIPTYVARDVDEELRQRAAAGGFLLLTGDSTAGKSRSAYEAIRATRPDDVLLVPDRRRDVAAAVAHARTLKSCVLWLSDLERFVGGVDGLTAGQVGGLQAGGGRVLICATLRAKERARLEDIGRSGDESNRTDAREVGDVLRKAETVHLERRFSQREIRGAAVAAQTDPQIRAAVALSGQCGLAEYLASGPMLLSRWRDGWAPGQHPRGAALVAAAVDCRRTGLVRPAKRELLVQLHEFYLGPRGGSRLSPEPLDDAFAWATQSTEATTALLHRDPKGDYVVFDYLVDRVQHEASPDDRVPAQALQAILDHADLDLTEAFAITELVIEYGRYELASISAKIAYELAQPLGPDHPEALRAAHNLARVHMWKGEYRTARDTFRQVLAARTRLIGADHPDTLATRHDYAWTLSACGAYEAARAEYEEVLALRTRVLGADDRLTLSTRHNYAWVLFQGGDPGRAREEYEHTLAARRRVLGPQHDNTVTTRHDLARVAAALGDYDFARQEYAEVLLARQETLGDDHPYVLTVRHNIAALAMLEGDLVGARQQFESVLADRGRVLGPKHPNTLITRLELGRLAAALGNLAVADPLIASVAEDRAAALGLDHPHTRAAVAELAKLRGQRDPDARAEPVVGA